MLVLSRKVNEAIRIGAEIKITIVRIGPHTVRVGIDAPDHLKIVREELLLEEAVEETDTNRTLIEAG